LLPEAPLDPLTPEVPLVPEDPPAPVSPVTIPVKLTVVSETWIGKGFPAPSVIVTKDPDKPADPIFRTPS
jgi:hypothetical protein